MPIRTAPLLEPCSTHAEVKAGWRCGACGLLLCPACTGFRAAGHGRIDVCLKCGGLARPIRERRALLQPFAAALTGAVRWPFTRETVLTVFSAAVVIWVFAKVGSLAALVADGLVIALMFHVVRHTAMGHDDLTDPGDFRGFFEDVLGPLMRCLVASVWTWGPFVAYVVFHEGGFFVGSFDALHLREITGPLPVLLLLGGTLLFPMSLLAGALDLPIIQLLNPLIVVGHAFRLGRDYWLLSLFCMAVSVTESILLKVLGFIDLHLLGLPDLVFYFVLLFPPLMMFRALGLLVRARGDELGYGGVESFLEPVLGKVAPSVELGLTAQDLLLRESLSERLAETTAVVVPHADVAVASAQMSAEFELPDEALSEPPPLLLARKIMASDLTGALRLLELHGPALPPNALSAQGWVSLSRACVDEGKAELGLLALSRADAIAPEGPLAPQSLLQAARVADEKLGDRARSNALLADLLRRFPGTAEARFAAKRLRST